MRYKFAAASLLLMLFAVVMAALDYQRFRHTPLRIGSEQTVNIEAGLSQSRLIERWAENGWIDQPARDRIWLRLSQRLTTHAGTIKIGHYRLRPGQSLTQAITMIEQGDTLSYSFTIIEGWTSQQLRTALKQDNRLKSLSIDWDEARLMQELGKAEQPMEGQFLPETYQFQHGDSDFSIMLQASTALDELLEQAWQMRAEDLPLKSPYQALILASIIEKETARADERELIAGVFTNRLNKGMRLQTDPTVIYGLGASFDGNLTRKNLRKDTPYNTYTRAGLPPTPIALPGRASIEAAVNPAKTDKLYFVATGDQGRHQFSSTLAEHEAAVRKYQMK